MSKISIDGMSKISKTVPIDGMSKIRIDQEDGIPKYPSFPQIQNDHLVNYIPKYSYINLYHIVVPKTHMTIISQLQSSWHVLSLLLTLSGMQIPRSSSFFEECFRQSTWIPQSWWISPCSKIKNKKHTYNLLRGFTLWLFTQPHRYKKWPIYT